MPDCLIVGGGVVGLSIAYELARRGRSVEVLEQQATGREASWAGAGILPPPYRRDAQHPLDQLRALSHDLHPQWAEMLRQETGIDNGYRRCGGVYLARSAGEAASLFGYRSALEEHGVAIERLSAAELAQLEPALAHLAENGSLRAAYLLPDEAQLRNPHHLQALDKACRQRGVEIREHEAALGFERQGGGLRGVRTSAGLRVAERYCITTGAWTHRLLKQLQVPNGILPIRGQMVLYRCPRRPFQRVLNEGPRYLTPRDDGRVLVGSTEEEAGFDKSTTVEAIRELRELAEQLAPCLREAEVEASWAGLRPATFDGFPYLGRLPDLNNAYVAAGHYRSGLHLSPGTALVVAELLCGGQPEVDLSPFSPSRG